MKIRLSSNDDKRLQTFDRITSYPDRTRGTRTSKYKTINFGDYTTEI